MDLYGDRSVPVCVLQDTKHPTIRDCPTKKSAPVPLPLSLRPRRRLLPGPTQSDESESNLKASSLKVDIVTLFSVNRSTKVSWCVISSSIAMHRIMRGEHAQQTRPTSCHLQRSRIRIAFRDGKGYQSSNRGFHVGCDSPWMEWHFYVVGRIVCLRSSRRASRYANTKSHSTCHVHALSNPSSHGSCSIMTGSTHVPSAFVLHVWHDCGVYCWRRDIFGAWFAWCDLNPA
ncbi:hypothetical protein OG21DRAFT_420835 [Imleria badia]|nr:hypothetical protein OG21DRAFT_420835 [Imleria badia]